MRFLAMPTLRKCVVLQNLVSNFESKSPEVGLVVQRDTGCG